jgi:UDP-N-acetylglucosamine 1-carboxyvinyltransferase
MEIWVKSGNKYRQSTVIGQGSKNAALPLIIASIFTARRSVLRNVPSELEDVRAVIRSLEWLGVTVKRTNNALSIDASTLGAAGMCE